MQRTLHFHDLTGMDSRSSAPPSTRVSWHFMYTIVSRWTDEFASELMYCLSVTILKNSSVRTSWLVVMASHPYCETERARIYYAIRVFVN